MDRLQFIFQKLLTLLRVRPIVGGFEVSDEVLRLVHFDGAMWQLHAERLEPGVLENGKIKDRPKFLASLAALKAASKIGDSKKKKVNVVLSLSSVSVYSQVFNLPVLKDEELAKAIQLNLQMVSPEEASKTYSGWQIVGKNDATANLEVLSSFIEKDAVDAMIQALSESGFLTMAVEPRSIALTRILREKGSGIDVKKSYLLVSVDNAGVDFLVIRNSEPYFEYNNRWTGVADKNGEISMPKFEAEITASLRQVLNFYSQHWSEPIAAVIVSAAALHDEIEKIVSVTAALPTVSLTLEMGQPISSEWLVALGCNLRGLREKIGESAINLLGEEWQHRFQEEQMSHFLSFWQVLVPVLFCLLILLFGIGDAFLSNTQTSLEIASGLNLGTAQTDDIANLRESSAQFNNEVAMISALEHSTGALSPATQDIVAMAQTDEVSVSHLTMPLGGGTITLSGTAETEDKILGFKNTLAINPHISAVDLPISGVQSNGGRYSFSVTFIYK